MPSLTNVVPLRVSGLQVSTGAIIAFVELDFVTSLPEPASVAPALKFEVTLKADVTSSSLAMLRVRPRTRGSQLRTVSSQLRRTRQFQRSTGDQEATRVEQDPGHVGAGRHLHGRARIANARDILRRGRLPFDQ